MTTTKDGVEVKVGQVWKNLDVRTVNDTVTIKEVGPGFAKVERKGGKSTMLSIRRMHKHSTGWELVSEPAPE